MALADPSVAAEFDLQIPPLGYDQTGTFPGLDLIPGILIEGVPGLLPCFFARHIVATEAKRYRLLVAGMSEPCFEYVN